MTDLLRLKPLVILAYPKIDHEKNYVYYWMPFSTLAVAKSLLTSGLVDVMLFDGNQDGDEDWERLLDANLNRVLCIGISIMTGGGQIVHALRMAKAIRDRCSIPIVFGGPHVNVLPIQTLSHESVDAVLVGPGQLSMAPFVEALLGLRNFDTVPGALIKTPIGTVRGPDNPARIQNLSGYPWHLIDVERYVRDDPTVSPRTLNYVSSQGCVYKCQFCYELTYKKKYSKILAPELLEEISALVVQFNITGVKFYDADWFVDIKRADEFSRGLLERNLHLNWAASVNPNDVLRARKQIPHLLAQIAQSGCTRLLMGVESGSDRVLNEVVKKEINRSGIVSVAKEIAATGIMGSYTFIVGFPGETFSEQNETFALIEELWQLSPHPETRVHLFAPYPGTPLFDTAIAYGFSPPTRLEEWATFDYYEAQTPWTNQALAEKARLFTSMRLSPGNERQSRLSPSPSIERSAVVSSDDAGN
ncbi:MAG: radical SAM protein [Candidatus Accumulibacter sp. UW25]|jgi:anaerobic magnesium-protoporphyrin IX monomethyl ester cyclase